MSPANMAKSVHQRLLNLRDETGEPFDRLLIRYGLERLLYRLQMAGYGHDFVLKGAMLFSLWQNMPGRRPGIWTFWDMVRQPTKICERFLFTFARSMLWMTVLRLTPQALK